MIYSIKNKKSLQIAAEKIELGKVIIYPTDTLYGFGVDATNCEAINELNLIKGRVQAYSIIVDSIKMIEHYAHLPDINKINLGGILPGPFTIILKEKKNDLSPLVNLNNGTLGFRIPNSKFLLDLVKYINKPIISTSVNKHNQPSLNNLASIKSNFPKIDSFIDTFNSYSKGSTILNLYNEPFKIIRRGDGKITL
mgnify:CR=1 FL=1|tara:strand:+ start:376 stop:960 length:585 start_codon:yes stop_codon:yes gene_type:complete